jgi:hypothetical protein
VTDSSGSGVSGPGDVPIGKKRWRPGCFTIGLALLIIPFVAGMIFGGGDGGGSNSRDAALVVACQSVVKNNLKSPSTAKFVGVPKSDGTYIRGEVDAQNSFGATIRNSFRCTIIDRETVRLDYLR